MNESRPTNNTSVSRAHGPHLHPYRPVVVLMVDFAKVSNNVRFSVVRQRVRRSIVSDNYGRSRARIVRSLCSHAITTEPWDGREVRIDDAPS